MDEPKFKAMFETSAEVLSGLIKAYEDYDQQVESAWRQSMSGAGPVTFAYVTK